MAKTGLIAGYGTESDMSDEETSTTVAATNSASRKRKKGAGGKGLVGYGSGSGSSDDNDDNPDEAEETEEVEEKHTNIKYSAAPSVVQPSVVSVDGGAGLRLQSVVGSTTGEVNLPPRPSGTCEAKIFKKILLLRQRNKTKSVNSEIQSMKIFRNPSIYEKMIDAMSIDETGSNSPTSLYDPHRWKPEDYYEELAVRRAEHETKRAKLRAINASTRTDIKFERVVGSNPSRPRSGPPTTGLQSSKPKPKSRTNSGPPLPPPSRVLSGPMGMNISLVSGMPVPLPPRPPPNPILPAPTINTNTTTNTPNKNSTTSTNTNTNTPSVEAARLRAEVQRKVKELGLNKK